MNTTFTIQSVHGLKQSFILIPGSGVTTVPPVSADRGKEQETKPESDNQTKPR